MKTTVLYENYLSKRPDNTYSIICGCVSINPYTTKENCLALADKMNIILFDDVWSCEHGKFITE